MTKSLLIIALFVFTLIGCKSNSTQKICVEQSEWRDNDGVDSCSYYSKNELCDRIIGKLEIKSRLHKSALKNGVFEGGVSSRWLEISHDSIKYYAPSGEVADRGNCNCKHGILNVNWEKGDKFT